MKWLGRAVVVLFVCASASSAEDKKPEPPLTLKVVAKTDKYKVKGGGMTADEYKKSLEATAKKIEKGEQATAPKAPTVDLVLQITNTSKDEVTIYVGGDPNVWAFELTGGAGTVTMNPQLAFTADFRL